jgi:hypothetical protein
MIELILIIYLTFQYNQPHYDLWTGRIVCGLPRDCYHEQAHKMNAESGWISESKEFKDAVDIHRSISYNYPEFRDDYSELVMFFPGIGNPKQEENNPFNYGFWHGGWGGYTELHAEIYAMAEGNPDNMPEIFRPFYKVD